MQKSKRAATAQDTVEIIEKGYYLHPTENKSVELAQPIAQAIQNSLCILEADFEPFITQAKQQPASFETQFSVTNETTLAAAQRWAGEKTLVLNFASAKNPGGGFLTGASAQEESLARSSALYPCLTKFKAMYDSHRASGNLYYNDDMILSPAVPVFKNDEGELLPQAYTVGFITAAAVNKGALSDHKKASSTEIEKAMRQRTAKVLYLARAFGYTHLILGAWGCGVFRNDPQLIAQIFADCLQNEDFKNRFALAHFAVLDTSKDLHIIQPFERLFGAGKG